MNYLYQLLSDFQMKDAIDIFVVTIIIYQFLLIIKGTRAVQVMLGLCLMALLFWGATVYELNTLNWLLASFFESFFIIIVILFQDQIRGALASLAWKGRFFGGPKREHLEREVDEIVEVVFNLSQQRVGSLIVIERTNGLSNYIETGTQINSEIHSDLLYALFQSTGPLHDGAVIISGAQIKAAGCYLPLAKELEIDRHHGTRHRAAIGMTESTDAMVITVSEETGQVRLAVEGKFIDCPEEHKLRTYLKHLWASQGPLDKIFAHN